MNKNKKKDLKVYERRRFIAQLYIIISMSIGLIMALIGTGGDYGKFNPILYFTGMTLSLSGAVLLFILMKILNE